MANMFERTANGRGTAKPAPAKRDSSLKRALLTTGSLVAASMALALPSQKAHAQAVPGAPAVSVAPPQAVAPRVSATQAFQANALSASAAATFARTGSSDVVTSHTAENIITWGALDTANSDDLINILPGGTSLTFVGPMTGYTIVNRILPTGTTVSGDFRGIAFNGNVSSRLGAVDGAIGGNIWFYSPGGIVIGAGSTFDVGGLALTTNDIDMSGGLFGANGEIRFSGAAGSRSSILVESGATINALNNGSSYVAMVAPRVIQAGTVTVDGSVAYVAAEQADLTINNGLFDIAIGVGTTDVNGVVHSGTTSGPASAPMLDGRGNVTNADAQAIYMVAVPKNDALTMLVGGSIGYQPAASAAIVNGNVVISAGADVATTGDVTNAGFAFDERAAASDANIHLQNAAFGSSLSAFATNAIAVSTAAAGDSVVAGGAAGVRNLSLTARNRIDIDALGGGTVGTSGDLTLRAGSDTGGGDIAIAVGAGAGLAVAGTLTIDSSALGGAGGSIAIVSDGGTIAVGRSMFDSSAGPGVSGRDLRAGDISLVARNGGAITSGRSSFTASAIANAGNGTGGDILIHADRGSIEFTDSVAMDTSGVGGNAGALAGPVAGQGGTVTLRTEGAAGALTLADLGINSTGSIADGGGASSGSGGGVLFDLLGGTFAVNDISLVLDGTGGASTGSPAFSLAPPLALRAALPAAFAALAVGVSAGDGGDGQGGDVTFNLNGGNATVTNLTISANGFGGDGADGDIASGTFGGNGGRGIGGSATFNAIAGILTVTDTLTVSAAGNDQFLSPFGASGAGGSGTGSDGGAGGAGIGGTAIFTLDGNAIINAAQIIVNAGAGGGLGGSSTFTLDGLGATLPAGVGGRGGDATGGTATFNNTAGTLGFSQLSVSSVGTGGAGGDVSGSSSGQADNIAGDGGTGTGGNATINIYQADLSNPVYVVDASGVGGAGGTGLDGGNGGAAFGGVAAINIFDVTANPVDPTIRANATGGAGGEGLRDPAAGIVGNSGHGGNATGGTARLEVTGAGGNIDLSAPDLQATATGGAGAAGFYQFGGGINGGNAGSGGDATGGTLEIIARTGATITISAGALSLTSTGIGGAGGAGGNSYDSDSGAGGNGGNATGGTVRLLAQGATITGNDLTITTTGQAGNAGAGGTYGIFGTNGAAGTGGSGTGGTGVIEVQEGSPGIITLDDVAIFADGYNAGDAAGTPTGFGGRIEITDSSTDPAGLITLASLSAQALNAASGPTSGFFASGGSGAIAITGDLTVNVAGNIDYDFEGTGQMTVGGNASLTSGQDILIDHANNLTPVNSFDVTGNFSATAQGNFVSTDGARIAADNIAITSIAGTATVMDDITAGGNYSVTGTSVTLGSAGIPILQQADGAVTITATSNSVNGLNGLTLQADADGDGTDNLTLSAGTNLIFNPGSALVAGDPAGAAANRSEVIVTTGAAGLLQLGNVTARSLHSAGNTSLVQPRDIILGDVLVDQSLTVVSNTRSVQTGDVTVRNLGASLTLAAGEDIFTGTIASNSGDILLSAGDAVDVALVKTTLDPAAIPAPTAASIGIQSGGNVLISGGLYAGEDIRIRAGGNIGSSGAPVTLDAGDDIRIHAPTGDIFLASAVTDGSGIDLFSVDISGGPGSTASLLFAAENLPGSAIEIAGRNVTGGDISAAGTAAITATSVGGLVDGVITLLPGATWSAAGSGDALILASRIFTNTSGATALQTGATGRFLVYSDDWDADTRGGIVAGNLYNTSFAATPPAAVALAGSRFIYQRQPSVTVAVADASREYGLANPAFTTGTLGLVNGDTGADALAGSPAFVTAANLLSNVGGYSVGVASGSLTSPTGYNIVLVAGTLTVNPALLTVTADDASREYGLANPALTGTITGFRSTDTASVVTGLSYSTGATQASNVGAYAINGSGASAINYVFAYTPGTLTINPALLTVTADDLSREYGLANPALTGTITGFRNADTASVVAGLTYGTSATQVSDVGAYAIDGSGASATNYTFAYNPGTLTINPALLTVTAHDASREYGLANPALTGTITGFRNADTASVVTGLGYSTSATQASDVGTYAIDGSGASATNYTFAYTPGTLTINPALLTVTAHDASREYGLANPALTGTTTGFRNADTAGVVTGLTYTTLATPASSVGSYAIDGSGASATNYTFVYNSGTLTVFVSRGLPFNNSSNLDIPADEPSPGSGMAPSAGLESDLVPLCIEDADDENSCGQAASKVQ